jgi:hypothetical protein
MEHMAKREKHKTPAKKETGTKVILMPDAASAEEEDLDAEEEDDEGGMYFEKEDVQLIYNALKNYQPTADEQTLYETLLESFEEMLVVDYGVRLPGFEFMDEEEE